MSEHRFPGLVTAPEIEVRFAFSGRIFRVNKSIGDLVKKGDLLASLDSKLLQAELDRQLADYEQRRAEFEIFVKANPNPTNDELKFRKIIEQAQLNISVKDVEIAKARLDQVVLPSPVNGLLISDGGSRSGLYVSPSSSAFTVLDLDALRFTFEITPDQVHLFTTKNPAVVEVLGKSYSGFTNPPIPAGKKFQIQVKLDSLSDLSPGLTGDVKVTK